MMPQYKEGQTATNPKTGQKIRYEGGLWVAVQGDSAATNPSAPGAGFFGATGGPVALSGPEQKMRVEAMKGAIDAQGFRADANRFVALNEDVATGGIDDWGWMGTLTSAFDTKKSEMRAIGNKMAPAMRQAGSGAMSDRDVEMYRSSTVGIDKPGPANQALAKVIDAGARRQSDYSAFLDEWIKNKKTTLGAQEAWASYAEANPLFEKGDKGTEILPTTNWRDWFGLSSPVRGGKGGAAPHDLSGLKIGSPEYARAISDLPRGVEYIAPDGYVHLNQNGKPGNPRVRPANNVAAPKTQGNGWKFLGEVK